MLAIQRPRMGTSQPSDGAGPFGYSFNPDDNLFLEPPEPAPGEPLLTLEDNQTLSSFFDQITSNQYSDMSFGEGLNFSDAWHGLPPQFMGTATTYGHHPPQSSTSSIFEFPDAAFHDATFHFMPPPPPPPQPARHASQPQMHSPIEQSTSADAAAVLTALHNGHGHTARSSNMSHIVVLPGQTMGPPMGHLSSQPQSQLSQPRNPFKQEQRTNPVQPTPRPAAVPTALGEQHGETSLFSGMAYGDPQASSSSQRVNQTPEDVRWGTDTSFARGQGFVPPSDKETVEAMEDEHFKYMECLKLNHSATNTRPPSPLANGEHPPAGGTNGKLNGHAKPQISTDALPRKRRKSKVKDDGDEDDEDSGSARPKPTARKRKSKADLGGFDEASPVNDTPGKRRKSNVNGAKPPRENLSEEQKRENHIKSEQKRRTLIREGFEDLQKMVPNLENGGYSKSAMLTLAGDWLADLIKGNEQLASR